ncbi:uncharacterized protein LOC116288802 [Actinia tenebrosa]|uniref:Uncharacterized protein LOC116288802 n=1 Tax=Actinia tenebrosa TaxID=6105 RepID=A0A6P8H8E5_ACTTE|nr:uncharacterized protein LOC116288802 [Actinia tenebrosa]
MSSQIPVVFLPSGISRISPDGFESRDPQVDREVLLYRERDQNAAKSLKLNEKIPRLNSSTAMEMLDKSEDFLQDMAIDEVEKMSDCEESPQETSSRPNSTEPSTANAKTLKTYQSHVRVFKDWLKSEGLPTDFEYCSAEELSSWLKKFYRDGKRKDGHQWKPSSLKIFRFAINQHLNSQSINRSISITRDKQFKDANKVISDRQKELIQLGEDATGSRESKDNARALTCEDIRQLFDKGVIGITSPKALHRYVFMILGINFGITSRLALHLLKPSMLYFDRDENSSLLYVYYDPKRDSIGADKKLSRPKKKIYGIPGNPLCPVTALKLFIQKRNPECIEGFFQTPNRHYKETGVWYTPQATGKNTLGRLMKDIAIDGKLSFMYTNHCLRYTPPYVFTPPDPNTLSSRVGNGVSSSLNAIQRELRPMGSESRPLQIRPTVSVNNTDYGTKQVVAASGMHFNGADRKSCINSVPTISYTGGNMPLLYPPVLRSRVTPLTNASEEDASLRDRDSKPSLSLKAVQQVQDNNPKMNEQFKSMKTHNVLCVSRQWEMDEIINAINAGDAILLSRHDVTGSKKYPSRLTDTEPMKQKGKSNGQSAYESRERFLSYLKSADSVPKHEDYIEDRSNGAPSLHLKPETSKLSSRSSRKQLEPKRIRPDEMGTHGDSNFQIDVAYDDAVTNIQANLTIIEKLQRDHPPSEQTINSLEKMRFSIERILSDYRSNIHM